MAKGVSVSPGVAVARAHRIDEVLARHDPMILDSTALAAEVTRFETACAAAADELDLIVERVSQQVGDQEASIFRSHRMLLRDPALIAKVTDRILDDGMDAASATQATLDEYAQLFEQITDVYIRERLGDVRDVVGRVLAHLTLQKSPEAVPPDEPVILVAQEILPSQAVMFERLRVAGIITVSGGTTGHAAILARALGIPAVTGLPHLLRDVQPGDLIIVDGREGIVLINPGPEVESAYRKLQREYWHRRNQLVENHDQEPISLDGTRAVLLVNVNGPADASAAQEVGANGVGLYRTEYLFLTHQAVPSEEEQLDTYRQVIENAPGQTVTIRTLDLGGDKHVPYLGIARESNPFMGWRSIRLNTEYPELFLTQLRAILRASVFGDTRLMFPMVSTLEEVLDLKKWLARAEQSLRRDGLTFRERIPFGVMIEVPGAALCIDDILAEVDFISIGSNDLLQYIMAADRDNPKVSHLCDPFGPAIYRLIHSVIQACNTRQIPLSLCGEMAGRPRCFLPLFGMGLRSFSMSPAFIPTIKELLRHLRADRAEQIAAAVLRLRTASEIKQYLTDQVRHICPTIAMFDTFP